VRIHNLRLPAPPDLERRAVTQLALHFDAADAAKQKPFRVVLFSLRMDGQA